MKITRKRLNLEIFISISILASAIIMTIYTRTIYISNIIVILAMIITIKALNATKNMIDRYKMDE